MAHNPHAIAPLPDDAFPGIVHQMITAAGEFRALFPAFHAFSSRTSIVVEIPSLSPDDQSTSDEHLDGHEN